MSWMRPTVAVATLALVAALATSAVADDGGDRGFWTRLQGFQEVPAISTSGQGELWAGIRDDQSTIDFELTYAGLEGAVTAAHIHLGQRGVNGGIIAFLCGGGGKPSCPQAGTVTGTITAADVIGPAAQGIALGELAEAIRAMRQGVVYGNVHSDKHPGGEIRGQLRRA